MHIFPTTGFDQSATTSVFLGVLVSWFFTETLGWVFVGLVVPGYLASLFLLDARSAGIDVGEAALTYGVARLLGELLSRTGWTSRAFGRERFLLVLVVSVLVRLGIEAVALPYFVPRATWAYSIGLVVVPLLANACWKTGLVSGLIQRGVPTLLVYLLLRFVLLPYTNLSLGGFYLATENVASSFLSSPKAYLILLTGATLAAAANVRWGWDYNGILVPALLSLTLGGPERLLITFAECLALVWGVRLLLRATPVGRWNIEGPRRPMLFFALDYALRFGLAAVGTKLVRGSGAPDLMGFGYLLPTLMAVKISRLGLAAPVLLPTASVSAAAYLLGTFSGFAAQKLDGGVERVAVTRSVGRAPERADLAALWLASLARSSKSRVATLTPALAWAEQARAQRDRARARGLQLGTEEIETQRLSDEVLLVRERFQSTSRRAGEPSILFKLDAPRTKTVLAVTEPLSEPLSALVAGRLLGLGLVDVVVVAGIEETAARSTNAAHVVEVARRLALRFGASQRNGGLVVTLRIVPAGALQVHAAGRVATDARVAALSGALSGAQAAEARASKPRGDEDVSFDLPSTLAESFTAQAAPNTETPQPLATSLDDLQCGTHTETAEGNLALRRLLLEPLLAHKAPLSLPLLGASATMLGFAPPLRVQLAAGEEAIVLRGWAGKAGLALVARTQAGSGTIVELPRAASPRLRRLGLALFAALDADVAIVNPCSEGDATSSLFEAAHREVVFATGGVARNFLEVRRSSSAGSKAGTRLGTWGPAELLASQTEVVLRGFGLEPRSAPLDRAAREVAGNDLAQGTSLVSVSVSPSDLENDAWRNAASTLHTWAWLRQTDEEPVAVAEALALSLAARPVAPSELLASARRAALEQSAVAHGRLKALLDGASAAAAVARSTNGPFLVIATRAPDGFVVGSFPLLQPGSEGTGSFQAESIADCAAVLASGGVCKTKVAR